MNRLRLLLVAVLAMFSFSLVSAPAQAQGEITFQFKPNFEFLSRVAFYSDTRKGQTWPGVNRSYELEGMRVNRMKLACVPGERICYGAWSADGGTYTWGVGNGNKRRCNTCCYTCDNSTTPVISLSY